MASCVGPSRRRGQMREEGQEDGYSSSTKPYPIASDPKVDIYHRRKKKLSVASRRLPLISTYGVAPSRTQSPRGPEPTGIKPANTTARAHELEPDSNHADFIKAQRRGHCCLVPWVANDPGSLSLSVPLVDMSQYKQDEQE